MFYVMNVILLESLLISSIISIYSFGLSICVFFTMYLLNKIVKYLVWPIFYLKITYNMAWFFVGAWIGSYIGYFSMFFLGIIFSFFSSVVQQFWD